MESEAKRSRRHENPPELIVVAPTFYSGTDEVRYALGIEACQEAAEHRIRFVLVDASPSGTVREGLEKAGRGYVRVLRQASEGKKGAALREGIAFAAGELRTTADDALGAKTKAKAMIGFQELEKVGLVRHWKSIASHAAASGSDIVVPKRRDAEFEASYPTEQYHSEKFANAFLDSLGKRIGLPSIDWTSGPVALDPTTVAGTWLACDGEVWDAQLLPIVDAFLEQNAKITSFEIPYHHPVLMKEQEGGDHVFIEKRLHQINFLSDTVGKRMREAAAGGGGL
mmetsp:Transcript_102811/g.209562  ORF Transcript_102811/g.209562 Transcript_102811/m.209562 type:complete len:283 (-) Transcript_102811:370-1218(-)